MVEFEAEGLDEAIRELRLTPKELERVMRRALSKAGQRVRTRIRQEARARLNNIPLRYLRPRLRGQRGKAWVGSNVMPASRIPGAVETGPEGEISLFGEPQPEAFVLNVPGQPVVQRLPDGRLQRLLAHIDDPVQAAVAQVVTEIPDIVSQAVQTQAEEEAIR